MNTLYNPIISDRTSINRIDINTNYKKLWKGSKYNGNDKGTKEHKKETFNLDLKNLTESFLKDMNFLEKADNKFEHQHIKRKIFFQKKKSVLSYLESVILIYENASAWDIIVLEDLFQKKLEFYIPNINNYILFSPHWSFNSIKDNSEILNIGFENKNISVKDYWKNLYKKPENSLWKKLKESEKKSLLIKRKISHISYNGKIDLSFDTFNEMTEKRLHIGWTKFLLKHISTNFNNNIQIQFEEDIIAHYNSELKDWTFSKGYYLPKENIDNFEEFPINGVVSFDLRNKTKEKDCL